MSRRRTAARARLAVVRHLRPSIRRPASRRRSSGRLGAGDAGDPVEEVAQGDRIMLPVELLEREPARALGEPPAQLGVVEQPLDPVRDLEPVAALEQQRVAPCSRSWPMLQSGRITGRPMARNSGSFDGSR